MEGSEELREMIVAMRRENDALRLETTHANLLLTALDTLLSVARDADPFAGVFDALLPVFHGTHAVVLTEKGEDAGRLNASHRTMRRWSARRGPAAAASSIKPCRGG
jgi:hypothetical protein